MSKKILVITGSPRKNGNSFAMTNAFIEKTTSKGHEVIRFDAAEKDVAGCKDCEQCFKNDKACAFDDAFNEIAPQIEVADAIVFTMPLYWFSFPAQLKAVIDKFHSFSVAKRMGKKDISNKESGLIVCCEDNDVTVTDGLVKSYESMIDYLNWKSVGTVLVTNVWHIGDIYKTDGIAKAVELADEF